ncbi:MAG: hypothetical protein DMF63_01230 [Acidobacteria bacterium]|nr:MAG: hypothetical protein DMF63_01230 [Acidobacteriota bacterium]
MKTWIKILLGLGALSPFVFTAAFVGFMIHLINTVPVEAFGEYLANSTYAVIMNVACLLFTIFFTAILVIYIIHAARNPILEANRMRTTWLISLCLLGAWVMPFYWFFYIWRDGVSNRSSGSLGLH